MVQWHTLNNLWFLFCCENEIIFISPSNHCFFRTCLLIVYVIFDRMLISLTRADNFLYIYKRKRFLLLHCSMVSKEWQHSVCSLGRVQCWSALPRSTGYQGKICLFVYGNKCLRYCLQKHLLTCCNLLWFYPFMLQTHLSCVCCEFSPST